MNGLPPELLDPAGWMESKKQEGWSHYYAKTYHFALSSAYEALCFRPRVAWPYYLAARCYWRMGMQGASAGMLRAFLLRYGETGDSTRRNAVELLEEIERNITPNVDAWMPDPIKSKRAGVIPLSVNIIVKNEEFALPRMLKSIEGLRAAEIVAVDTGSNDNTINILEQAGAKILHAQWNDDFAAPRNMALENSSQEWVVWFDADDELASDAIDLVRAICTDNNPYNYHFFRLAYEGTVASQMRLWRRSMKPKWQPRIHERIWPDSPAAQHPWIVVRHYDDERRKDKWIRNLRILEKAIQEDPCSAYFRFYMAITQHANSNDIAAKTHALAHLGMTFDNESHIVTRNYMRYLLAWMEIYRKEQPDPTACMKRLLEALVLSPCSAELWCLLGDAYVCANNRLFDAYACYEAALHVGEWSWSKFWLTDASKYDKYPKMMMKRIEDHYGDNFKRYVAWERYPRGPSHAPSIMRLE